MPIIILSSGFPIYFFVFQKNAPEFLPLGYTLLGSTVVATLLLISPLTWVRIEKSFLIRRGNLISLFREVRISIQDIGRIKKKQRLISIYDKSGNFAFWISTKFLSRDQVDSMVNEIVAINPDIKIV